jgi:hypothetical protein
MAERSKAKLGKFRLTAVPDAPDFRDWIYRPALVRLKEEIDPPDNLKILNQGSEGASHGRADSRERLCPLLLIGLPKTIRSISMFVCEKIIAPAQLGEYELHVSQNGTSDAVHGARAVNGVEVETWTHSDLVENSPQRFIVNEGERHSIKVFGTFIADDIFNVDLRYAGDSVGTCELKKDGDTSSSMGIVAPSGD